MYKYKVVRKDKWIWSQTTLWCLFYQLWIIQWMIMFRKPNIAIIIITMLKILLKKMAHIEMSVIFIPIETMDSLIRLCKCGDTTIILHLHRYWCRCRGRWRWSICLQSRLLCIRFSSVLVCYRILWRCLCFEMYL